MIQLEDAGVIPENEKKQYSKRMRVTMKEQ
jgi:hypothetical protein